MKRKAKRPKKVAQKKLIPVWTTADGNEIPITELEDSHLVNILRFLHRRKRWFDLRSVIAADCNYGNLQKELSALNAMDTYIGKRAAIYDALKEELSKRASRYQTEIKTSELDNYYGTETI